MSCVSSAAQTAAAKVASDVAAATAQNNVDVGAAAAAGAATTAAIAAGATPAQAAIMGQQAAASVAGAASAAAAVPDPSVNTSSSDGKTQAAIDDNKLKLQTLVDTAVTQQSSDENSVLGFFTLNLPSASCAPFVSSIHGYSVSIDVCKYTNLLRDLIGWLFAVYGAIAVYETLLRKV
jgi:hypothetical protein